MHEDKVLQSESMVMSDKRVKNVLHIERLQRSDLHRVLTCQSANNNVTQPITSSVTLDLNRKLGNFLAELTLRGFGTPVAGLEVSVVVLVTNPLHL